LTRSKCTKTRKNKSTHCHTLLLLRILYVVNKRNSYSSTRTSRRACPQSVPRPPPRNVTDRHRLDARDKHRCSASNGVCRSHTLAARSLDSDAAAVVTVTLQPPPP
jgi:hypothetical protein